jgi:hypothetical protein
VSFAAVTLEIPDWFFERLGSSGGATLERLVLEALVAGLLRTGRLIRTTLDACGREARTAMRRITRDRPQAPSGPSG